MRRSRCPFIPVSLFMGVLGHHFFGQLGWLDSLLNAMILTGMGPVDPIRTPARKLFASTAKTR